MSIPGTRDFHHGLLGTMQSHFSLLLLFAGFVSLIFAVLIKDEPTDQAKLGGILFASFVATALVLGWVLFPFPL